MEPHSIIHGGGGNTCVNDCLKKTYTRIATWQNLKKQSNSYLDGSLIFVESSCTIHHVWRPMTYSCSCPLSSEHGDNTKAAQLIGTVQSINNPADCVCSAHHRRAVTRKWWTPMGSALFWAGDWSWREDGPGGVRDTRVQIKTHSKTMGTCKLSAYQDTGPTGYQNLDKMGSKISLKHKTIWTIYGIHSKCQPLRKKKHANEVGGTNKGVVPCRWVADFRGGDTPDRVSAPMSPRTDDLNFTERQ